MSLLIVDDDNTTTLLVRHMANKMGYVCQVANDGSEAIRAAYESHFDFILMDIYMPIRNGLDAAREIRLCCPGSESTVIIGLLSREEISMRSRCLEAGMDDIMIKPVDKFMLSKCFSSQRNKPNNRVHDGIGILLSDHSESVHEENQENSDFSLRDLLFVLQSTRQGVWHPHQCQILPCQAETRLKSNGSSMDQIFPKICFTWIGCRAKCSEASAMLLRSALPTFRLILFIAHACVDALPRILIASLGGSNR